MAEALTPGLRQYARCGGCAAKMPREAVEWLGQLAAAQGADPQQVLVGLDPYDDAAVYALDAQRALVATVDFFPPIVDDAADFGAIAAANAASDIYAMGGDVAFALALSGFPAELPLQIAAAVAESAARTVRECGGIVLGGHSIRCAEPLYGLCVLGFVHPARIWRKRGAQPGDRLLLSKPLGTGVLVSANEPAGMAAAIQSMRRTNRAAAESLKSARQPPHAVTDISGYGLLGHLGEMLRQSAVAAVIDSAGVPLIDGALPAAQRGVRTSAHRQAMDAGVELRVAPQVPDALQALLVDPQTSGGLLAAVPADLADALIAQGWVGIGHVESGPAGIDVR